MQSELQKSTGKPGKRNILLISILVFSLLMLAASAQLIYMLLKYDRVYKGVCISNLNAGGMTNDDLAAALKNQFQDKTKELVFSLEAGSIIEKASFASFNVTYAIDSAAKEAFLIGRRGNIFERLYDIIKAGIKGTDIVLPITYDKDKLDSFINGFYEKTFTGVKEAVIFEEDSKVSLRSGHHGQNVDKSKLVSALDGMIKQSRGGTVKAEISITAPARLDVEELFARFNREPVNSVFKIVDGQITIEPHTTGMKIGKTALAAIVDELEKNEDTEKILPVEFIQPEITSETAASMLFKDQLAYMGTHFSTSTENDRNRGENIKLAVAKITGKILLPGEIFSFNEAVGPRTEEGGYQTAHTYIAGKVVDGIGGGICQVSSTLYGAVLKADLEVIERRNHMFTVGYVPYGQDATVSYGTTDFRFKNSTNWPIRIEAGVTKNNNVYFSFTGTREIPDKKVIITQKILKKIPFTTKYIDDPAMLEGSTSIKQEGKEGYIVDTFKAIKVGDKIISETKLHTSKYRPLEKEILRGTKKPDTAGSPPAVPAPAPAQQGIDDADNPPAE